MVEYSMDFGSVTKGLLPVEVSGEPAFLCYVWRKHRDALRELVRQHGAEVKFEPVTVGGDDVRRLSVQFTGRVPASFRLAAVEWFKLAQSGYAAERECLANATLADRHLVDVRARGALLQYGRY